MEFAEVLCESGGVNGADHAKTTGERVKARIVELRTSQAVVVKYSDVSRPTWQKLFAGQPVTYPHKRAQMSLALGWSADSIDRLLAGGEPAVLSTSAVDLRDGPTGARIAALEQRLAAVVDDIAAIRQAVADHLREPGAPKAP